MSDQDIKDRLNPKVLRMSELQSIAKSLGIDLGKARSKEVVCAILSQPANLLLLQSRPDLLPELRPDPKAIKAEAERKKIEADAEAERKKAEADAKVLRIQRKREALDTSTKVNRAMGFTFVALMFYILLIVAGTTDLQLFLPESTVRLPIVEVELPLLGFYSVVPFLILVFHFHLLINLKHHNDKYRDWRTEAGDDAKEASLDPILINFKDTYPKWYHPLRILIVLVVSLSVFYFPLVNLTLMQWRFGDYHDFWISTFQFFATLLDTALIMGFFSKIGLNGAVQHRFAILGRVARRLPLIGVSTFGLIIWMLALKLKLMLGHPGVMPCLPSSWTPIIDLSNSRDRVGEVADGYVLHYMRDSLDADEARQKALAAFGKRMNLDGRDFRFANFERLNLTKANLQHCRLDSANLSQSNLEGADLSHSCLNNASLFFAKMKNTIVKEVEKEGADLRGIDFGGGFSDVSGWEGASLRGANLRGVKLNGIDLNGVDLTNADLTGAILIGADLQGAKLQNANLPHANLQGANLQGANLQGANLRGANLQVADLQVADLQAADLQGADLQVADLRGADLVNADLRGADLRRADLRGADLRGAHLEFSELRVYLGYDDANLKGADLEGADLEGADLEGANLTGAILKDANLEGTILDKLK